MTPLEVLFIGGTGEISAACSHRAVEVGMHLHVLNRGRASLRASARRSDPLTADARDRAATRAAIRRREFDVVVDFVGVHTGARPGRHRSLRRRGPVNTSSSAPHRRTKRRSRPCRSRSRRLYAIRSGRIRRRRSPARTSSSAYTASRLSPPRSSGPPTPTTARRCPTTPAGPSIDRMRRGKDVVVHGDGASLWTLTHSDDFAKAFVGAPRPAAGARRQLPHNVGRSAHLEPDPRDAGRGRRRRGADRPCAVRRHPRATTRSGAAPSSETRATRVIFDNAKVRRLVPDYTPTIPFAHGARDIIDWHDADPARRRSTIASTA